MTVTNAMRLLTQAGIPFETSEYPVDESDLSGIHAAEMLGVEPDCVFKTLVARGASKGIYVFVIPVAETEAIHDLTGMERTWLRFIKRVRM